MVSVPRIAVVVVWSPAPRQVEMRELTLDAGSTVRDALVAGWGEGDVARARIGVWGRRATLDQGLRDGDRVELYRALRVDPKRARRERFGRQGAGAAGLFARRRPGAKPGY